MSAVFLLLENHFFKTPDGKIWCDRIVDYGYLNRYLQSFDRVLLCGRSTEIPEKDAKDKLLVSGEGISFVGLPDFIGALGVLKNLLKMKRIIRNNLGGADCAILRGPSPLSLMTYSVFKKFGKPFVIEFVMSADKMFDSRNPFYEIINKILVKRAQKMCLAADGVSYVTDHILQEKYPCKKRVFTTNYSSIDLTPDYYYKQDWEIDNPPERFRIVHTGYMDSCRKGQDVLIETARLMVEAGQTNFEIMLIGDGKMRPHFEKMVSDYGLKKYVKFVGAINDKSAIRDILTKSHLFVFPSRSEGLPRAMIEAMAVGLVCVAPSTDGVPELIDKRYLVKENEACCYAEKIISIMNDWQEMIVESRKNNARAKEFEKSILDGRRKNFYDRLRQTAEKNKKLGVARMSSSMDKKRITLVISQLSGGGAERVTCNLANYLDENGYKVDIVTLSEVKDAYEINLGVSEVCLLKDFEKRNLIHNNSIRRKRLKQYIKNNGDISCYVSMLSLPSFILTSLKKYIKCKIIVSERNNPGTRPFAEKIMMEYSVKKADGLVVQTKEIEKYYKNTKNIVMIPNAINKDIELPKRNNIEKKIVSVGRLEKQKNYPMLIKAFAIFHEEYPEYRLEIYGRGSQKQKIMQLVKQYGLTKQVIFAGHARNISEKIVGATCFAMTSNYEGMSNALIEAMCIGIPCIVTDCDGGGARELIKNNENGILIKKNAVSDMSAALSRLISNEGLQKNISENARKLTKMLDPDVVYKKWLDFIENEVTKK